MMKKTAFLILMAMVIGLTGCSTAPVGQGNPSDVGVMFVGKPLIFDSSVVFMGSVVGQVLSSNWGNGITRVSIALDSQYDHLKKNNMAAVMKNGRMHLEVIAGYGDPLSPGGCINGFVNTLSYRLFKFTHLINNITMSADRRAQHLMARYGLAG